MASNAEIEILPVADILAAYISARKNMSYYRSAQDAAAIPRDRRKFAKLFTHNAIEAKRMSRVIRERLDSSAALVLHRCMVMGIAHFSAVVADACLNGDFYNAIQCVRDATTIDTLHEAAASIFTMRAVLPDNVTGSQRRQAAMVGAVINTLGVVGLHEIMTMHCGSAKWFLRGIQDAIRSGKYRTSSYGSTKDVITKWCINAAYLYGCDLLQPGNLGVIRLPRLEDGDDDGICQPKGLRGDAIAR